uniref:Envelope glycoprotein N n=3 Tax=root TaxID=1 RepID=A0A0A0YLK1_HUMAN|nr:envelope glycoprotein N [Homo sapiens]AKZ18152.1 envelope glycoprotein N [Human betaherpesvirus 6A]ARK01229.1 U46 [Human betaherpesvirus 6]AIX09927.1 envelope glycoprotein N [Homo sapiens]AIX09928.1 envelope glycoprotein N [Homo sapiens]
MSCKKSARQSLYVSLCLFYILVFAAATEVDFYSSECHSHTYEIVLNSFSSIWLLINLFLLLCSFAIFLKYWCYKTFASETVKGY